jgi:hypothetical protein
MKDHAVGAVLIIDNEAYRQAVSSGGNPYDHFRGSYAR